MATASHSISSVIQRVERRSRVVAGVTVLLAGLVVAGGVMAFLLVLDAIWPFGLTGRWMALATLVSTVIAAAIAAVRMSMRKRSPAAMARLLERVGARDDNALVNAVQLEVALAENSPWRHAVREELAVPLQSVLWSKAFSWRRVGLVLGAMAGLGLLALGFHRANPEDFPVRVARLLQPNRDLAPITRTRITDLQPGHKVVPLGTEVRVNVQLAGELPQEAWLVINLPGGKEERLAMHNDGTGAAWSVARRWDSSAEYHVLAGDAVSFARRIEIRAPAKPLRQALRIEPPAYTRLAPSEVSDVDVWPPIVAGSRVAVAWEFDRTISAFTVQDKTGVAIVVSGAAQAWSAQASLLKPSTWQVDWHDADSIAGRMEMAMPVKPDMPPRVAVTLPALGEEVRMARDAWLKLAFQATDDFAVDRVVLYHGDREKPNQQEVESWSPNKQEFAHSLDLPIARFLTDAQTEVVFQIMARDANSVTGPGITWAAPIVVRIVSAQEIAAEKEAQEKSVQAGLEDLARLQQVNLEATRAVLAGTDDPNTLATLVERQVQIEMLAGQILVANSSSEQEWQGILEELRQKELPAASLALRSASTNTGITRTQALHQAVALETTILARLRSLPTELEKEAERAAMQDIIARVEQLFQRQKDLRLRTQSATPEQASSLTAAQDALADDTQRVRVMMREAAQNPSLGDAAFRKTLEQAATAIQTKKIYEDMLRAAGKLEQSDYVSAGELQKSLLVALAEILEMIQSWQAQTAGDAADALKKAAETLREDLNTLAEMQKEVIEKSQELASKDTANAEDVAVASALAKLKSEMEQLLEKMLTDAHVFPDLRPMNTLRDELTKIFEDVIQSDKEAARANQLKPTEIAVQKEQGILDAIKNAMETAEDMEMWLPDKNETAQWLLENFDRNEMPEIPNLPLADAFTDLVGELLEEQEDLAQQVQDAASNQAFATNPANGWDVMDGPMPGFNAQGRSGNEKPNKNEQTGRSSGGREGMSSGEMVNGRADNLEGRKPDARRTNDPLQQGAVADDGGPADARATGGGKASGSSQREGMGGEAPVRPSQAPRMTTPDALAAEQAILARQTARGYATARLFYLRTGPLPEVAQLMDASRDALKAGHLEDFQSLHRRIVGKLQGLESGTERETITLHSGGAAAMSDKRLLGGEDFKVPAGFEADASAYFKSLDAP